MKRAISFLVGLLLVASPAAANTFTYEAPASQTATVGQSILTIWELSNGNWDSRREALVFPQGQYGYEKAEGYLCPNEKVSPVAIHVILLKVEPTFSALTSFRFASPRQKITALRI